MSFGRRYSMLCCWAWAVARLTVSEEPPAVSEETPARQLANATWGGGWSPKCLERTRSAKAQFSLGHMRAFAQLAEKSSCSEASQFRDWTCPECEKVGFEVVPRSGRLVKRSQLGEVDATSIYVAKLRWLPAQKERPYTPRARTPVKHSGESCLAPCGGSSGWCAWCGIGQACCHPTDNSANSAECTGATFAANSGSFHQCVETTADFTPEPLQSDGQDCYDACGQAEGFCHACGSGNACCHPDHADAADAPPECRGVRSFTSTHHECVKPVDHVAKTNPLDFGCAISFRGTRKVSNTIKDFTFIPVLFPNSECRGCQVHKGFLDVWEDVERKVVRVLADLGCRPGTPQSSLLITGHSMGAALSTLSMFTMQARGYSVAQAYNFASPRVGNAKFASTFWNWFDVQPPLYRVTHSHDMVSQVPPHLLFHHTGSEVFFPGEDATVSVICGCEESRRCQAGVPFWKMMLDKWSPHFHCLMPLGGAVGNVCQCDGKLV